MRRPREDDTARQVRDHRAGGIQDWREHWISDILHRRDDRVDRVNRAHDRIDDRGNDSDIGSVTGVTVAATGVMTGVVAWMTGCTAGSTLSTTDSTIGGTAPEIRVANR